MDIGVILEEIKRTLEITESDLDEQIKDFINRVSAQLKVRLGFVEEIPKELEYIIVEASIRRFVRKGDEGTSSYSQEGESVSYGALLDEFDEDIQAWKRKQEEEENKNAVPRKGVVRFI